MYWVVLCEATLSGGAAVSWDWSGGETSSNLYVYRTRFDSAGEDTISVTVSNAAGSDSASRTITVTAPTD